MKQKINAEEILAALPSKYYVVNLSLKEIVKSNDPTVDNDNNKCYRFLFGKDSPCEITENCICRQAHEKGESNCIIEKGKDLHREFFNAKFSKLNENHIVIYLENVTSEFSTKKELKINTKRLERAERLASFGYWEFNIDEKIMIASKGAIKIYGAPSGRMTLEEIQSYPLKRFRKKLNKGLSDLISKGKPYNIKFQIKRPDDGEIRCIHSIAEYREDKRMVFGVIHDITEAEKAQKALVESENSLKQLFNNMNSGFAFHKIITDRKGTPIDYIFLDINAKFEEIIGVKKEHLINKRILEVLPKTEKIWIERYGEVALTGKPVAFSDYFPQLGQHFEVSAYSPKKNYFAITFTDISDRVHSEIALKESLADLKIAQKSAKLGSWKYNPINREMVWSDQVFNILERNPSDGVINFFEYEKYFQGNDFSEISKTVKNALTNNVLAELQFELKIDQNKLKWVKVICQPFKIAGRTKDETILYGTIQDITESKKAEEELSNANKLLRTVIDNIPDAIYMKDAQYRKIIANKGDALNIGFNNVEEIIGKTDYEIYPKEIADVYAEDDKNVIEKGETVINREEILPSKEGNRIVLTSKFPLRNNENKIVGLVGIGRDITEFKQKEQRLQLLQKTIEQSPLPVIITKKEGGIEYVNPAFTVVTGYSREEAMGQDPVVLLEPGENKKLYAMEHIEAMQMGRSWNGEIKSKKRDGTFFWNNVVFAPIFDDNHNIQHFVAISEDVTEKKKMVENLKVAKEKAEESSRLKSIFLANLSHEIRTPLNGILGFSSIICSGVSEPDKLKQYGEIVEKSGRRLIKVIDDIIDMSVLQSNQLRLEFSEFDINEIITELFDLYKELNYKKLPDINFSMELSKNGDNLLISDKIRVKQVISNLLDNSFKFTDEGFIRFGYFCSDEKQITLFVEDSGIGIEKDKTNVIFEPFRQVEEGDSRKYEGPGLGLAISAAIMEKLEGGIELKSKKGKGSVFYLKFPRL